MTIGFKVLFSTEYPVACYAGSKFLQNLYPKGQNSVILRPLAAEIGVLKIFVLIRSILNINSYKVQMRLANSLGDKPEIGKP